MFYKFSQTLPRISSTFKTYFFFLRACKQNIVKRIQNLPSGQEHGTKVKRTQTIYVKKNYTIAKGICNADYFILR